MSDLRARWGAGLASAPLIAVLVLPLLALTFAASPTELWRGVQHPSFGPALWLSARTSALSLGIVVLSGTPLAWWLSRHDTRASRALETLVTLPIVLPPAVVGIALLELFGRHGWLGGPLASLGFRIPFSTVAVVLAQIVLAAPFYVQSAAAGFRKVDPDLLLVARTLGVSGPQAVWRVAVPLALPGLTTGVALAWARALGEFGATLLFAGNRPGVTQTLPLAIYAALESDVHTAVALALVLGLASVAVLLGFRGAVARWAAA
ncbi:MAG: ABC transporter permease [Myxococcota bacterium]